MRIAVAIYTFEVGSQLPHRPFAGMSLVKSLCHASLSIGGLGDSALVILALRCSIWRCCPGGESVLLGEGLLAINC